MGEIKLEIDGNVERFRTVWVHLQNVSELESVGYRIVVSKSCAPQVFDPSNTRDSETSWPVFVQRLVAELGTFVVEGFVENISNIVDDREREYRWVIATVDKTLETERGIELVGRAVPFLNR